MIHVDRSPLPPAIKVYTETSYTSTDGITKVTKAVQEKEKAIAFFTNQKHYKNEEKITTKRFPFTVYKNPALSETLEEVFRGKCAYCESQFAHIMPKDIEHYRPKNEIDTGANRLKPGYYWLAGEWDNLLASCIDCNRSRRHSVPGQSKKVKLGKGTQFPLEDESQRVRAHTKDIFDEEPVRLLLNPCIDNPEDHLTFSEDGLVRPRKIGVEESKLGRCSIDVYALQRGELVDKRRVMLSRLKFAVNQLLYHVKHHNELVANDITGVVLSGNKDQIHSVSEEVVSYFDERSEFLAILRDWVRKANQAGEFELLLQFGIDLEAFIQG